MTNNIKTYIIWSTTPDTRSVRDFVSLDTRTREIWHRSWHTDYEPVQLTVVREYASSNGTEYFISIEDQMWYLYGFTRLCLPDEYGIADWEWLGQGTAMIRELHVYGQLAALTVRDKIAWDLWPLTSDLWPIEEVQHTGLGRQLMSLAEQISIKKWYHSLSVISWVWVRWYYQKLGYELVGTYLVKEL
jgi:elongator complex protein 3